MVTLLKPDEFQSITNVSRETLERLIHYAALLRRWQRRINLVSPRSMIDPWRRHFLDSAQLLPLLPPCVTNLVDLGSGAGFPGLVLAAMGVANVHLIEANQRKTAFLRFVNGEIDAGAQVHAGRVEALRPRPATVVTARACAPLPVLLGYAERFLAPGGLCLFLKGRTVDQELTNAAKGWRMHVERIPSISASSGTVLRVWDLAHGRTRHDP